MAKGNHKNSRRNSLDKAAQDLISKIKECSDNLTLYLKHEFVRCYMGDGSVFCGYVYDMSDNNSNLVLHYPFIEKSSYPREQLTSGDELTIDMKDVYKMVFQRGCRQPYRVESEHSPKSTEVLSMGILDTLIDSTPTPNEEPKAFDDSERRIKAQANLKHHDLENNFTFLTQIGEENGLEEASFRMGAYDQFQINKDRFGVDDHFDLKMYTMEVDKSLIPLELQEEAAKMEKTMRGDKAVTNIHVLEERGVDISSMQKNDEELYSTVQNKKVATPEKNRRGKHAPPKEEKELSRSIMKPVEAQVEVKLVPKMESRNSFHEKEKKVESPKEVATETAEKPHSTSMKKLNAAAAEFVFTPKTPVAPQPYVQNMMVQPTQPMMIPAMVPAMMGNQPNMPQSMPGYPVPVGYPNPYGYQMYPIPYMNQQNMMIPNPMMPFGVAPMTQPGLMYKNNPSIYNAVQPQQSSNSS